MRNFALLFLGVVVGWAASGVDWSREAVGEEGKLVQAQVGLAETPVDRYKALERVEVEKLGGRTNDRNLKYLSAGLNALAAEGWSLVAIEPAQRYTISGPGNASGTLPAVYIFERRRSN